MRLLLEMLVSMILAAFVGFASREFSIFRVGMIPEMADVIGIGSFAAVLLIVITLVNRQARGN